MSRKLSRGAVGALLVSAGLVLGASDAPPLALASAGPSGAMPTPRAHRKAVPGEVIVRFRGRADAADRSRLREGADTDLERTLPLRGLQLLSVERGQSVSRAVSELERSHDVLYAEPNFYVSAALVPNDPLFGELWGLHNTGQSIEGQSGTPDADIDAPEAWDLTTGSPAVTVAVVDTGVDYTHPDLRDGIWANPGETGAGRESNGLDDDGDGFRDDWRGWDWVDGDNTPSDLGLPGTGVGHGTHVAGTVAARGNDGAGVAGVAWGTRVMPLRVLNASGAGNVADLVSAFRYAAAHGARVVNASLEHASYSQAESDAITSAPATLFVVAAGNGGTDLVGDDNDVVREYPCDYPAPNLVCVAASDARDALAAFSNYGVASVDLAAPGVSILSTLPGSSFGWGDGTSMAAPHASGVAALLFAAAPPSDTALVVRGALLGGVDQKPAFTGKTMTGGRLNAERSLRLLGAEPTGGTPPPASPPPPAPVAAPTQGASLPPAADRSAPSVSLRVRRRQRLGTVISRGLLARVACSERCSVSARLVVDARTARRLALSLARRATVVGRFSSPFSPSGALVRLRIVRSAKRKLRRARRVYLTLQVVVRDPVGNSRSASRRILLVR